MVVARSPCCAYRVFVEVDGLRARVIGVFGGDVVSLVGVVDQPVVIATQGYREVQIGRPAFGPRMLVMQLRPREWSVTPFRGASVIDDREGGALGVAEEPVMSTEVEDLPRSTENGGEDPGLAGDPPRSTGREECAGVGARGTNTGGHLQQGPGVLPDRLLHQCRLCGADGLFHGHRDDHGGGDFPGESFGVQVFDQLGQGPSAAVRPVDIGPVGIPTGTPTRPDPEGGTRSVG